jgi:hypothetical protein
MVFMEEGTLVTEELKMREIFELSRKEHLSYLEITQQL